METKYGQTLVSEDWARRWQNNRGEIKAIAFVSRFLIEYEIIYTKLKNIRIGGYLNNFTFRVRKILKKNH